MRKISASRVESMAEAASAVPDDSVQRLMPEDAQGNESALSVPVGEGGGALSPLSGAYLLVVLSEPLSEAHKTKMVQKLRQGNQNHTLESRKVSVLHITYRLLLKTAESLRDLVKAIHCR